MLKQFAPFSAFTAAALLVLAAAPASAGTLAPGTPEGGDGPIGSARVYAESTPPVTPLPDGGWLLIAGLAAFAGYTQRDKLRFRR